MSVAMDLDPHSAYPPRKNRGNAIGAINGVFLGFGLVLVCVRVYVRTKVIKTFGWDDIFIIVALIAAFIAMGIEAAATHNGLGQHLIYLEPEQVIFVAKWNRIGQMPWVISNMFIKLSISVFLYRIFAIKSSSKRALYPIIILNIIGNLASFTTILSQCTPVSKLWNPSIPGKCWNPRSQFDISIFQGSVSAFCDFALAFLPIVFLWNIQIKKHVKFGICFLMGLGFFTGTCAIIRTVLYANETAIDFTYTQVTLNVWAILEMGIGIIVACVPTIRPLMHSGICESLYSRLTKSYPKFTRQRYGGIIDIEDQQRLQRIDSIENVQRHLSPGVTANIAALSDKRIAKADLKNVRSYNGPVPKPVYPRSGIVKTTDFQLTMLEH